MACAPNARAHSRGTSDVWNLAEAASPRRVKHAGSAQLISCAGSRSVAVAAEMFCLAFAISDYCNMFRGVLGAALLARQGCWCGSSEDIVGHVLVGAVDPKRKP